MWKTAHPDQRYITALLNNDALLIGEVYKSCALQVKSYICFNRGSEDDAANIFQDALIDIYHQAKNKDLQLSCQFNAFVFLLCKRKWLTELKKKGLSALTTKNDDLLECTEEVFALADDFERQQAQQIKFMAGFEKLGERCKEVIRWSMQGQALEEVADTMGVTHGQLRRKKSECMASLIKIVEIN